MGDRLGTLGAVGIPFFKFSLSILLFFWISLILFIVNVPLRKNIDANSTQCSQAVTHPSTNRAQHCLTSVIGRELVCSM